MDIEFIFYLNAVFGAVFCGLYIWVNYKVTKKCPVCGKLKVDGNG